MPNQRAKNKVQLGGYMPRPLRARIERMAKREGMEFNVFGFAQKLMREAIAVRKRRAA